MRAGRAASPDRGSAERHLLLALMAVGGVVAAVALGWSSATHSIVLYGDAATHLQIARRVVDSLTPGLGQLGTSWLPLLHVLELPLIWNDHLWHSGLAGGIVSSLAGWASLFFAFRLAEALSHDRWVAFMVGLLLLSNLNLLYLQTTPMNESLFVCTALGSTWFLVRWAREDEERYLVLGGLLSLATALNRYEGWALAAAQAAAVALVAWRRRGREAAEGMGVAYASLAGLAPLLWFSWNWALFGSPVDFLTNRFSSRSNTELVFRYLGDASYGAIHDWPMSFLHFALAALHMLGPAVLAGAGAGLAATVYLVLRRRADGSLLPLLALAAPALFLVYAIYDAVSVVFVPELPPHLNLNIRYGLYALPLALGLCALAGRLPAGRAIVAAILGVHLALVAVGPPPMAYDEPRRSPAGCELELPGASSQCVSYSGAPAFLGEHYDGGRVLVSLRSVFLIHDSGLDMREFVHEGNRGLWEATLADPAAHVRWVAMVGSPAVPSEDLVFANLYDSPALQRDFQLVFERWGVRIYRLRGPDGPPGGG
ncbi:MAG TPA: hypothetical protein VNL95_04950 [Dehalococcoidia bacterium]|nr:hypothetical protein [Dehalococcoidia bacterium]